MRQKGNGCSFCSRVDTGLRSKTPRQVYDEFRYLVSLGADRIEEFSDSWLYDRKWLRELIDIIDKEGHWGVPVRIYGDVRHIQDEEIIEMMKRIGVDSVILGIESGNESILMRNGKNIKRHQILKTASLLGDANIMTSPSYVLGLIGETKQTLQDTFEIADEIRRRCKVEVGTFCTMTPFPGSKAWKYLLNDPSMHDKYSNTYHFDIIELQKDFIARFTDLGGNCYCLEYISNKRDEYARTRKEAVALLK
jgi:radical SAM superfamily enzyme YgiQ (UPF0313 family)